MRIGYLSGLGILGLALQLHALEAPRLEIETELVNDSLQIQLDWNDVVGASSYSLFQTGVEAPLLETGTSACSLVVPLSAALPENLSALFTVVAVADQASMTFLQVPAGTFLQGEEGVGNALPEHSTTLSNDFLLGVHPVTNQQYLDALQWAIEHDELTGVGVEGDYVVAYGQHLVNMYNDSGEIWWTGTEFALRMSPGDDANDAYPEGYDPADHPVKNITWYGAACFCDWLSIMEGLTPFYQGEWNSTETHNPYLAEGYRLPMEAEWEYAAQFNDGRLYPWGDGGPSCGRLNYFSPLGLCVGWTTPVGSYGQSGLGFHDLAGNIREWCGDFWGEYTADSTTDPLGAASHSRRVIRGCGWAWNGDHAPNAYRHRDLPAYSRDYIGMRVARTAPTE